MSSNISYQKIGDISPPKQYFSRKSIFLCLSLVQCFLLLFLYGYFYNSTLYGPEKLETFQKETTDKTYCYDDVALENSGKVLATLDTSDVTEASVFFVETRCHTSTADVLTKRQACAVESAAFTNPDTTVYVLFPSEVPFNPASVPPYIRPLLDYPNIKLRHISMTEYVKATPLDGWYEQGALKKSVYPLVHISDVLRLLTLWKFGGIYLDLDTVTLKSLEGVMPFAAIANMEYIGNAAIGSLRDGIGHVVLTTALERIKANFHGSEWGANGPVLLTEVLRHVCQLERNESIYEMNADRCEGFNVFPATYFHPLPYYEWEQYFSNGTEAEKTMARVNGSYSIHTWNKMSHERVVTVGSDQPYSLLARRYCPLVYNNMGEQF